MYILYKQSDFELGWSILQPKDASEWSERHYVKHSGPFTKDVAIEILDALNTKWRESLETTR